MTKPTTEERIAILESKIRRLEDRIDRMEYTNSGRNMLDI